MSDEILHFVQQYQSMANRLVQEINGWSAVTATYTSATMELTGWLKQRIATPGSTDALLAIEKVKQQMSPVLRTYAVGMESGTRQVIGALDDLQVLWSNNAMLWKQASNQIVDSVGASFLELANTAKGASASTKQMQASIARYEHENGPSSEGSEALGAMNNAIAACQKVGDFAQHGISIIEASRE
jgi:hypothetical protein